MKRNITLLLFAVVIALSVQGQDLKLKYSDNISIEKWEVVDLVFTAKGKVKNPFAAGFSGVFKNGSAEMIVPGFYNGGNEWIIRFSASETGVWKFSTLSEIKELNGKLGKVMVTPNTNAEKHGGVIVLEDNPQHFYYQDSTPYMQLAYECDWLFALDYHNETAIPKTEHHLDLLKKYKLNQVVTTVYSFDVSWTKDPKLAEHPEHEYGGDLSIYPFKGTNREPDFSGLNIEFFQKFDRVMSAMNSRNISAHLMIYVWNKMVTWPEPESEADNMYFDYIIKRYQAFPNVIWDVSKEALNNARCTEEYGRERIARIRKLDTYKRLVSVHDYGFCTRNSDVVDFISVQSWESTLYSFMNNIRTDFPTKPVFNIEHGGYEVSPYDVWAGDFISPEICLRRNYLIQFAGVYSTYYWQGASWNAIIHNPYEQPDSVIKPRFDYYKHLVDFFEKYEFHKLKPATNINFSGYTLTNNDSVYLIYIPKENYQFSGFWNTKVYRNEGTIQWFNTLTGEYSEAVNYTGQGMKNPWYMQADVIMIREY